MIDFRKHVRGDRGPRRHQLPSFARLATGVPEAVLESAREIAQTDQNDLQTEEYKITVDSPHPVLPNKEYRQILYQTYEEDSDPLVEDSYSLWTYRWNTEPVKEYLESQFGEVCRARVAVTPPGEQVPWHIDTDTSVLCRIQIAVETDDNMFFEFERKKEFESFTMKPGEMWFINTGWNHRVVNVSDQTRVVIIAGVLYENLKHLL